MKLGTAARNATAGFLFLQALVFFSSNSAFAVPSFARQTGLTCAACHVGFPELTPFGRMFKLNGYTMKSANAPKWLPLAVMIQASVTSTRNTTGVADSFPRDGDLVAQQASLFYAGRITDKTGAFVQWTYDGVAHHSNLDNTDLRYADKYAGKGTDLIYGFTLNNNPTSQDVWNSTPAFGYPYAASSVANGPAAATLIDGGLGQQVAGLGAYAYWNKTLYGELSAYRTADQVFSVLRAGQDTATSGGVAALDGYNPYWRLALTREWGPHSVMAGTYGMVADVYPDNLNPSGPTDRFKDIAFDAQYQYLTEPHSFTAQATWIHEKTDWNASYPAGGVDNPSSSLNTFRANATYYYQRKYGATLSYFSTTGDTDATRWSPAAVTGSANGSPDSSGYIMEADYLPLQNVKLALQYTAYQKFNGASTNYDGYGRNASDNDTLYLLGWFMF